LESFIISEKIPFELEQVDILELKGLISTDEVGDLLIYDFIEAFQFLRQIAFFYI
jgi:hypothetical protein